MALLVIEILCVFILTMTLSALTLDERRKRKTNLRQIKVKGYWEGEERRAINRFDVCLGVKYSTNGKFARVKSVNMSTRGIRLLLDEKLEKGAPLRMEIKIPTKKETVKTTGEVAWSEESGEDEKGSPKRLFNTGIKFLKVRADDEKKLFDFIHDTEPPKV